MNIEIKKLNTLIKNTKLILVFLSLEFVLGMMVNLFAVSPDDQRYLTEPIYLKLIFALHGIVGLVILAGASALFIVTAKLKNIQLKKTSLLGLIFVLIAFLGGIATVMLKDVQSEIASLVMSLGFIAAFISYGKFYLLLKQSDNN